MIERPMASSAGEGDPSSAGLLEPRSRASGRPGSRHVVETTTPTGHTYRSTAPPMVPPRFVEVAPGRWTLVA